MKRKSPRTAKATRAGKAARRSPRPAKSKNAPARRSGVSTVRAAQRSGAKPGGRAKPRSSPPAAAAGLDRPPRRGTIAPPVAAPVRFGRPAPLTPQRKGYSRRADIPRPLLEALNDGREETATLAEWLAVDHAKLMRAVLPDAGLGDAAESLAGAAQAAVDAGQGVMDRMRGTGTALFETLRARRDREEIFRRLAGHASDVVRSWASLALAADPRLTLEQRLAAGRLFAVDRNMSVREVAWLSFRPFIAADLPRSIELLTPWVYDADPNVRRCAVEATRPRGVWCSHIDALKRDPAPALPLLEPLRAEANRYPQMSVANWLNDASKSRPDWVRSLCKRWSAESKSADTKRIIQRATRTMRAGA